MTYRLFLDDEREPPDDGGSWVVARSYREAISIMITREEVPYLISFDHDLGEGRTGYDLAKWLVETDLWYGGKYLATNFRFVVHSQNPIGKQNIEGLLSGYLKQKEQ